MKESINSKILKEYYDLLISVGFEHAEDIDVKIYRGMLWTLKLGSFEADGYNYEVRRNSSIRIDIYEPKKREGCFNLERLIEFMNEEQKIIMLCNLDLFSNTSSRNILGGISICY